MEREPEWMRDRQQAVDLERALRRMDLLNRLTRASQSGRPWRPARRATPAPSATSPRSFAPADR
ncbi:hypothetical protein [Pengzhenrongella sicca]|uniref:Uncharacterized protein n=1 Tax=Pengzhenrongella sicca TaxID=2819238 RepID=A0A8A4ZKT3_9MICO|nr:hypothetical protein [Pengzhenrongella sicca]QTE30188.1 hypothetical protein J4E96_04015 [Pengzhenrongella sicca]